MTPYCVAVVASSSGPGADQLAWLKSELRQRVDFMRRQGLDGNTQVRLVIMPLRGLSTAWVETFMRPPGVHVEVAETTFHLWENRHQSVRSKLHTVGAEEVWCMNAPGQTQMGKNPVARFWRDAQPDVKYKLIPSWATAYEPNGPKQKGKRSEANGIDRRNAPVPAREAGGGRTERAGQGFIRTRAKKPRGGNKKIPWFGGVDS